MNSRVRDILLLVVGLAVVLAAAFGGYAAVRARAQGSGTSQALAPVATPKPAPPGPVAPQYERWTVGKAVGPVTVYRQPSMSAPVKTQLGKVNQNGYPTLVLVDTTREVDGRVWYRVSAGGATQREPGVGAGGQAGLLHHDGQDHHRPLPAQAPGVSAGGTPRKLPRSGRETRPEHTYRVLLRQPEAPAGDADGPYGVLAIGISAFQPKLAYWPQGGPVAIHGTNEPWLIGKAISHGCVRMQNKDVLEVSRLVPAGSPVEIVK